MLETSGPRSRVMTTTLRRMTHGRQFTYRHVGYERDGGYARDLDSALGELLQHEEPSVLHVNNFDFFLF